MTCHIFCLDRQKKSGYVYRRKNGQPDITTDFDRAETFHNRSLAREEAKKLSQLPRFSTSHFVVQNR